MTTDHATNLAILIAALGPTRTTYSYSKLIEQTEELYTEILKSAEKFSQADSQRAQADQAEFMRKVDELRKARTDHLSTPPSEPVG
jgi:hypothetical protein